MPSKHIPTLLIFFRGFFFVSFWEIPWKGKKDHTHSIHKRPGSFTRSVSRLWLSFCLACASLFVSLVPPVLVKCDMLDDHCYKAFIAKFAAKGFSLGCYFFLLVCVCVCVPALRVCCSLCLVIVAGIVWGLVCPHICCAWIGWDWGRCCFGVCVVCVGCLSQVIFCVFVKSVVFTRKQSSP